MPVCWIYRFWLDFGKILLDWTWIWKI